MFAKGSVNLWLRTTKLVPSFYFLVFGERNLAKSLSWEVKFIFNCRGKSSRGSYAPSFPFLVWKVSAQTGYSSNSLDNQDFILSREKGVWDYNLGFWQS